MNLIYLFHCRRRSFVCLSMLKCTCGVINSLYHCRHSARDRQHLCDYRISAVSLLLFVMSVFRL